jgi:pimeloyl-ACP methyl ester carboxylesterase
MGAWIALLAAKARPRKVAGLLLIAPAADFTESLIWARMSADMRREVVENGFWLRPSAYGDGPYPITRALIEDGRKHLLLDGPIGIEVPVHIVQGMRDPDVPWQHAMALMERLSGNPMLTLIREGDHRLSSLAELARIEHALDGLLVEVRG